MDTKETKLTWTALGQLCAGKISDLSSEVGKIDFDISKYVSPQLTMPIPKPESTVVGEINKKIEQQNSLLLDNYNKLEMMYKQQVEVNIQANKALKISRIYNGCMLVITFIAMIAAVVSALR